MNLGISKTMLLSRDSQPVGRSEPATPLDVRKVLVADDDEVLLGLMTQALTEAGYDVDAVSDGGEAWESMLRTDYDLLVTDNDMPKMTGQELVARIRELGVEVPTILFSGGFQAASLDLGSAPGITTLPKPFCMLQLVDAVTVAISVAMVDGGGARRASPS